MRVICKHSWSYAGLIVVYLLLTRTELLKIRKRYALGRNVDEVLKRVDAIQFNEEYGVVCPAYWNKGDKAIEADHDGVAEYFK